MMNKMDTTILKLSDEALLAHIRQRLFNTPNLKIGDNLSGPTASVWDGKELCAAKNQELRLINFDTLIPHYEVPAHWVVVKGIGIPFEEFNCGIENFVTERLDAKFDGQVFLYPYSATIPHRGWLTSHKPGDRVLAADDAFLHTEITLTEEHFLQHSYVIFRFAISP